MADIDTPSHRRELRAALRCAAAALKRSGPRFALAGSYALWVYGGPEPDHDVDLVVADEDVADAADTLAHAGFTVEHPPEDWLFKAHRDSVFVDVLHKINGEVVTSELLDAADCRDVLAIRMPVLPPALVLIQKLRALGEHDCDLAALLPAVRATRERLQWNEIRAQTDDSPYAAAFLLLADRLGLSPGRAGREGMP